MRWITEERYAEQMREEVEPWLEARMEAGFDERVKGQPIYFEHYRADGAKAVIVISHGFTESIQKFKESVYYMLQAGYEVWGLDHRGHGRSFRLSDSPYVVHAERFDDYALDLIHLTETRVKPAAGERPIYLFCHSMGGCVGVRAVELRPELFAKAVLSSPMLGVVMGKIPTPIACAMLRVKGAGAKGREPMAPVAGFTETEEDCAASAANSDCRFRYYIRKKLADPRLQTCAPSMNWIVEAVRACRLACSKKETAKIRIPVLLFQAGRDSYVRADAQERFAARVPSCELQRFPALKHELYMSDSPDLIPYWEKVFAFLGQPRTA